MTYVVEKTIPCPFVYAKGHRCEGLVYRAKAYGSRGGEIRMVRLHCSEQGDHNGNNRNPEAMAFWPDHLPESIRADVLALFDSGQSDVLLNR